MKCNLWEFFTGKPFEEVEEKFHTLYERASHLREHITRLNTRLDHIEDTLNNVIVALTEKK